MSDPELPVNKTTGAPNLVTDADPPDDAEPGDDQVPEVVVGGDTRSDPIPDDAQ